MFNITTRRAALQHLSAVGIMMFILLIVAWTIDLADVFPRLRQAAESAGDPLISWLAPYLTYRATDIVTRLLPMAIFFGVFLSEIIRRLTLESVVVEAAGASRLRSMAGVLWVALILGLLQGVLETRLRPAAVWAQVDLGYGHYGRHFRQGWMQDARWFFAGDMLVRGEVLRSNEPALRNVVVFEGVDEKPVRYVHRAETMLPLGEGRWQLREVTTWTLPNGEKSGANTLDIEMPLIPQQIRYSNVEAYNLPTAQLRAFAVLPADAVPSEVRVALWRRRVVWLIPLAYATLGKTLAQVGFDGRKPNIARLFALGVVGYISVLSLKVIWALGELAVVPAVFSVTAAIGAATLAGFGLPKVVEILRSRRRRSSVEA